MSRRLLNAATVLSTILFVATVILWARSYWKWDFIGHRELHGHWVPGHTSPVRQIFKVGQSGDSARLWYLDSSDGTLGVGRHDDIFQPTRNYILFDRLGWTTSGGVEVSPTALRDQWNFLGFGHQRESGTMWGGSKRYYRWRISVPHWALALLTAALPARRLFVSTRRRRRLAAGQCLRCGYDLRVTRDRCPECGTPVPDSSRRQIPQHR